MHTLCILFIIVTLSRLFTADYYLLTDLEDQERLLQKKREALGDAKAVLDENQLI